MVDYTYWLMALLFFTFLFSSAKPKFGFDSGSFLLTFIDSFSKHTECAHYVPGDEKSE